MKTLEPHHGADLPLERPSPIRSLVPVGTADSNFAPPLVDVLERRVSPARRMLGLGVACLVLGAAAVARSHLGHGPAALEPTAHVASGTAGIRTNKAGMEEKWRDGRITVVIDGSVGDLGKGAADGVKAAFGAWAASGANLPALMFDVREEHGHAASDGVNRILVAPITLAGHEKDVAITIGYTNDATGEIVEADIVLNSAYHFGALRDDAANDTDPAADCSLHYDVQNIVTHEGGHFFGLGEDMSDPKATMYYRSAPCQTHKRDLTESDRGVMASLYEAPIPSAPRDANAPVAAKAVSCAASPGSPADFFAVVVVAMAAAAAFARRRAVTAVVERGGRSAK